MKIQIVLISGLILLLTLSSYAQESQSKEIEDTKYGFNNKHFIGTQGFVLFTPFFDPSPEYYQLSYGYRLTSRDELSIEAVTWAYQGPLGRPYGPDYEQESTSFPGDVKTYGGGLAYKRFLWKGVFAQLHSYAFRQLYRDEDKEVIQKGFQLFNTLRFGYHFKLFKNKRWFISPSVAATFWPVNTNLPESFQVEEDKYPNYFLFEPGLQIGYSF